MTDKKPKMRGLGRGLSALMADVAPDDDRGASQQQSRRPDFLVPIEKVFPNPNQPRRSFVAEQLEDLASSIREKGVIQPLIVRRRAQAEGSYEIVAGERRWRAAQMAQLHELPVLLREFDDTEVLEIAIIENIQRADLNPVEEAVGYKQLMEKFGHTQDKLSEVLGKSRSYIANLVRLLQLPEEVQGYLREGKMTAGHARALITASDPVTLARKVIQDGLSVRETERLAKAQDQSSDEHAKPKTKSRGTNEKDADTRALEADLSANLSMKVSIQHEAGQESGLITVRYESLDDLDVLCQKLGS
jgi:ParB family transcriptional regulator, chromosome partitioning protein